MADKRKLQADIDRTLKKISEGRQFFQETMQKFEQATTQTQREKFEADLKKEIKKLQRFRDQIKNWVASNDIKDKRSLCEARKDIESDMERFKVIEKETKTKAYSKEGLGLEMKKDPLQREKEESEDWFKHIINSFKLVAEKIEFEIESQNLVKKKRNDRERLSNIEAKRAKLEEIRNHIKWCETCLRALDNDNLDLEKLRLLKDDIESYCNHSDSFEFSVDSYEELVIDVDKLDSDTYAMANRTLSSSDSSLSNIGTNSDSTPSQHTYATRESTRNSEPPGKDPSPTEVSISSTDKQRHRSVEDRTESKGGKGFSIKSGSTYTTASSTSGTSSTFTPTVTTVAPLTILSSPSVKYAPSTSHSITPVSAMSFSSAAAARSTMPSHLPPPSIPKTTSASNPPSNSLSTLFSIAAANDAFAITSNGPPTQGTTSISPLSLAVGTSPAGSSAALPQCTIINSTADLCLDSPKATLRPTISQQVLQPSTAASKTPLCVVPPTPSVSSSSSASTVSPAGVSSTNSWATSSSQLFNRSVSLQTSGLVPVAPLFETQQLNQTSPPMSSLAHLGSKGLPRQNSYSAFFSHVDAPSLLNGTSASPFNTLSSGFDSSSIAIPPLRAAPTVSQSTEYFPSNMAGTIGQGILSRGPSLPPSSTVQSNASTTVNLNISGAFAPFRGDALSSERLMFADQLLDMGYRRSTRPEDSNRARMTLLKQQPSYETHYPREPVEHFYTEEYYSRLDVSTLFFIFYYFEGSRAQYLASRALKKKSWRFHKRELLWFQRLEEPKSIDEEYESGTYVYWDVESKTQKKKENFTFEYQFLEDMDLH